MSRSVKPYVIMDAKAANGVGNNIFVKDYKIIGIQFNTDGGGDAAGKIQFQGSMSEDSPDFSAARSVTNKWDYKEVFDLEDGGSIDGDDGITLAGADDHRELVFNVEGLNWVNAQLSSRTEGEFTITCVPFTNA
jgi:hypothetical protein